MGKQLTTEKPVGASWGLLYVSDRRRLVTYGFLQAGLSLLDLVGVLLLGLVALSATASITTSGQVPSTGIQARIVAMASESPQRVLVIAALAGGLLILKSVLSMVMTRTTFRFLAARQADISSRLAAQLFSRPLLAVQRRSSQETVAALLGGVGAITMTIIGGSIVVVVETSLIVALTVALILVDPLVTLFTVLFFGSLVLILQRVLGDRARRLGARLTAAEIESYEAVQDSARAYREITVAGRRPYFIGRIRASRVTASEVLADTYLINQAGKYVFEIGLVVGAGLLVAGVAASRSVAEAVGVITVFLAASARIFPSLLRLQSALLNMRNAAGLATPTLELISELEAENDSESDSLNPGQRADVPHSPNQRALRATVELQCVSLVYPGADGPALSDVSFAVRAGETVAIVGPTGSGKSTLADVVLGVLVPDSGAVLVSGEPPSAAIELWPGRIAYVPQHISLLNTTVRANVALGRSRDETDDAMVWQALERAHLAEFLRSQRDGIDTLVGENGVQLSGGQRQRLGIARALYSRPELIVLDEATSALDAQTESDISDTLQSLSGEATLIVIAHRLATVMNADRVVYMHGGKIVASGTFREVRAQVPEFDHQAHLLGL